MAVQQQISDHLSVLEEKVFQVGTRWPHFKLLLADVKELADETPAGATVVLFERTLLYGVLSLLAPMFPRQRVLSVECSPASADGRGAYNAHVVDDPRFLRSRYTSRGSELETGLEAASADLLLVPNLVHHVGDQAQLFAEIARVTKPGGRAYIFEPLVRELHQVPDDYLRYTPYGLETALNAVGLDVTRTRTEGGPFQVIAYCWEQALQYFPEGEREARSTWFWKQHFPELMALDGTHRDNLVRKHTSFPMAFSVLASRRA